MDIQIGMLKTRIEADYRQHDFFYIFLPKKWPALEMTTAMEKVATTHAPQCSDVAVLDLSSCHGRNFLRSPHDSAKVTI